MVPYPLVYHEQMPEAEIGLEMVAYVLRKGERLVTLDETEEIEVTWECLLAVQPVSSR